MTLAHKKLAVHFPAVLLSELQERIKALGQDQTCIGTSNSIADVNRIESHVLCDDIIPEDI
jgi:hypothetical protein